MADKIELSVECVRALLHDVDDRGGMAELHSAVTEACAALAKHEQEKNPLGLPWTVDDENPETEGYWVSDNEGATVHHSGSKATAYLIAAAPDLAQCLAELLEISKATNGQSAKQGLWEDRAEQLLKKAGRGGVSE